MLLSHGCPICGLVAQQLRVRSNSGLMESLVACLNFGGIAWCARYWDRESCEFEHCCSSAATNFVREGPVNDVVWSPTIPSFCFLTVENWYTAPVKVFASLFRGGHGLFGLILAAPLNCCYGACSQRAIRPTRFRNTCVYESHRCCVRKQSGR